MAPNNSAFFHATGFWTGFGAGGCFGPVIPLGGFIGGGPTGGVGGTAWGPVDGKPPVGRVGGGENWPEES